MHRGLYLWWVGGSYMSVEEEVPQARCVMLHVYHVKPAVKHFMTLP